MSKTTANSESIEDLSKPSTSNRAWIFIKKTAIQPLIRFLLGLSFGLTFSIVLAFFPFPNGKYISFGLSPIVIILAILLEKYTQVSTAMPVTLLSIVRGKTKFSVAFLVYMGMYFGASYVSSEIHTAINTSPEGKRNSMQIFMEKLFLGLNESIEARLKQCAVITTLFYGLRNVWIQVVLHVLSFVWLATLPEMNPALATGWFRFSKHFDGTMLAHFWINLLFFFVVSIVVLYSLYGGARLLRWMKLNDAPTKDKKAL